MNRSDIKSSGISDRKYEYLIDLCGRIENESLQLSQLQSESEDTIRHELNKVKGIGDWTVDMYLLFGLAKLDIFPINDLALRRIMGKVYAVQQDDTEAILRISERWQPYRSVGAWYLYRHGNRNA